jgi:hypothetical protein
LIFIKKYDIIFIESEGNEMPSYSVDYKFGHHGSCGSMTVLAHDEEEAWAEAYCILCLDNKYENVLIESIKEW